MVLAKYFFKRFFKYVFTIGLFLAFLINFIEFFEKIVHVKQVEVNTIITFISLNFIPCFFDLLGISSWLATCLLIKEFYQQNEWEAFAILNINYNILLKLFLSASFCLMCFSIALKETVVENLNFYSEHYKMEKFKQKSVQKILGKWLMLNERTIAYLDVLDLSTNSGSNLLLLYMNQDFTIQKVLNCKQFLINTEEQTLIIPSGLKFDIENNQPEKIENLTLVVPALFSQIKINLNVPTLINIYRNILNKNILPISIQKELIYNLLNRLVAYLKLIIYPVLTFMLFALFWNSMIIKWIAILIPYILLTFSTLLCDYLFARGFNPIYLAFIYLFIVFGMLLINRRINMVAKKID